MEESHFTKQFEAFKIIGLKIDGIRKLSAVEMEFAEKGLIEIRGKNQQGKTSVIDSLEILLKGGRHIETDMISHDKKRAEIIGVIGDYEIRRVITEKTNRKPFSTSSLMPLLSILDHSLIRLLVRS